METSSKYKVSGENQVAERHIVLSHIYTQTVKDFMLAMINADYVYDDVDQLIEIAMELSDTLIKKTGEKL